LTHAAIYDYRLEPGAIDIIITSTRRNLPIIASNLVISILLSPWHTPQFMIIASNLVISILLSPWHAAIYDYRLEPGDIDIIIALTRRNLWLSPPNLVLSILLSPTHAVYSYHLEPGDIILLSWHTPQIMIIASNLVISMLLSPWHTPQFMIIAWTWWYRYYYRLDTPQFMIIALNLVISILLSPCHNLWLSPWNAVYRYWYRLDNLRRNLWYRTWNWDC
jgi:hypothetical protein